MIGTGRVVRPEVTGFGAEEEFDDVGMVAGTAIVDDGMMVVTVIADDGVVLGMEYVDGVVLGMEYVDGGLAMESGVSEMRVVWNGGTGGVCVCRGCGTPSPPLW